MSDRTDEATRDPSAPEPEPEPVSDTDTGSDPDSDPEPDRDLDTDLDPGAEPATEPNGGGAAGAAERFTEWLDREYEGDRTPDYARPADVPARIPADVRLPPLAEPAPYAPPGRDAFGDRAGRVVTRIFRRPTEWATSDWPTRRIVQVVFTVFALTATTAIMMFVVHLNPLSSSRDLVFDDTTPTGGDFGAHVWGPAFLRDNLLPAWRLNGWSMDWYAGLPTYRFYMVVPALFVVAVDSVLAVRDRPEARRRDRTGHTPGGVLGVRTTRPVPLSDPRVVRVRRPGVRPRRELQHLRRQPQVDDGGRVLVLHRVVARHPRFRSPVGRSADGEVPSLDVGRARRGVLLARHRADLRRLLGDHHLPVVDRPHPARRTRSRSGSPRCCC